MTDPWIIDYLQSELQTRSDTFKTSTSNLLNPLKPTWLYLWGTTGSGKTHLLQATYQATHALAGHGVYCALSEPGLTPSILEDLEQADYICLDDIHLRLNQSDWAYALFQAFNRWYEQHQLVLVSAHAPPAQIACVLPDLRSRLAWSTVYHLEPLTDHHKLKALQHRAQEKGFALSHEVGSFLLTHCPRSLHTLFAYLDHLSQKSLEEKRPITIPFVKKVLLSSLLGNSGI